MKKIQIGILNLYFILLVTSVQIGASVLDNISSKLLAGISRSQILYSLHTSDTAKTMDCLKVCYQVDSNNHFGIFHAVNQNTHFSQLFYAQYLNSTKKWRNTVKLSDRGSQGTVMRVINKTTQNKQGYFVAYELENPKGNKIAIRYYESQQKLKINNFLYEYQLVAVVSGKQVTNVGTPSIQQIKLIKQQSDPKYNQYQLSLKFHYSPDGSHDFPGQGFAKFTPLRDFVKDGKWIGGCYQNYSGWQGLNDTNTLYALRQAGCNGKIGQRDYFFISNSKYYLYQCNLNPSFDWYSWRIVLYSPDLKQAKPLGLVLGGDIDIANPHISLVSNQKTLYQFTMTFFLPSQGTGPEKDAKPGQCIVKTKFSYP